MGTVTEAVDIKTCGRCKKELPATLEYFYADSRKEDGLKRSCKECSAKEHEAAIKAAATRRANIESGVSTVNSDGFIQMRLPAPRKERPRPKPKYATPNRHPMDFMPTDPGWVKMLLKHITFRGPIWEPAAGNMHISKVFENEGYDVRSTDLITGTDFLEQTETWNGSIVTNPPFVLMDPFVLHSLELATEQVAYILPAWFMEGITRYSRIWSQYKPQLILIGATRMTVWDRKQRFSHAWYVWDKQYDGPTEVRWDIAQEEGTD